MPWYLMLVIMAWALPAWAATYYVDSTCSDGTAYTPATRACTGGSSTVRDTVNEGVALLSAGDWLYIRGGTYSGTLGDSIPNGTGATGRTVISAYPTSRPCGTDYNMDYRSWGDCVAETVYEPVVFSGPGSARISTYGDRAWIVFEGLQFRPPHSAGEPIQFGCDGSWGTNPPTCDTGITAVCPHDLVFAGLIVDSTTGSSFTSHYTTDVWLLASTFLNCGAGTIGHCHYFNSWNGIVYRNQMLGAYSNGAQYFKKPDSTKCLPTTTGMLIERNVSADNGGCGLVVGGMNAGAILQNNLSVRSACGISLNTYKGSPTAIYNNTLMHNQGPGVRILAAGDFAIVKNNVMNGISIDAGATDVVQENNYNACSTCTQPPFLDPSNNDYRVPTTDTLLVNQGQNLAGAGVAYDFFGIGRPQGATYDIGYAETTSGGTIPFDFSMTSDVIEEEEPQIAQGTSSAAMTITVATLAGTPGSVAFSASNLPPLATASFDPTSCTPTGSPCTSALTITAANGTPEGGFDILVRGTTAGGVSRTTTVPVEVICE